jgi:long-chain fatty acid transport protein
VVKLTLQKFTYLICLLAFFPATSIATNGLMAHGYGTTSKALGGAGSARPQDALMTGTNPASGILLDARFDMSVAFMKADLGYEFGDNSMFGFAGLDHSARSTKEFPISIFILPSMAFNFPISSTQAFGFSMYGAGLGAEYEQKNTIDFDCNKSIGASCKIDTGSTATDFLVDTITGELGVSFQEDGSIETENNEKLGGMFLGGDTGDMVIVVMNNFNYSQKINERSAVGVGLIFAVSAFEIHGIKAFAPVSEDPEKLSGDGESFFDDASYTFGGGVSFGANIEVTEGISFAAAYRTKIELVHEKYAGMLPDGGHLDWPPMLTVGFALDVSDTSVLVFDIQKIWWSESKAYSSKFENFIAPSSILTKALEGELPINKLGSEDAPAFGFDDSLIYKIGFQMERGKWIYRIGYSHQNQIVQTTETLFGSLAPPTIQDHFTFGFSRDIGDDYEFNFAFFYAPMVEVEGEGFSNGVKVDMQSMETEFSFAWK